MCLTNFLQGLPEQNIQKNRTMKVIICSTIALLSTIFSLGQEIIGKWNGLLKVPGTQLRLTFNVLSTENGYSSTLDSPDQGASGIPVTKTTFKNNTVRFEVANLTITYEGQLQENEIIGTFSQGGQSFSMNLSRNEIAKVVVNRPQEPNAPFSYYSEDLYFSNSKENIRLAGTLTLPDKNGIFPVVILISGSGPQDRNEEIAGHKPFLVIADYLTKNGIGVLRYDDRGFGKSEGEFSTATSKDFATDVESAVSYLKTRKDIDPNNIGLAGHSEGGLIAPMVASTSEDIAFIVLLAGPGISGDQILLLQQELIARSSGISEDQIKKTYQNNKTVFDMIANTTDQKVLETNLTTALTSMMQDETIPNGMTVEAFVSEQTKQILSPWMQFFIKYDPAPSLEKVTCPVLAVNGEKDLQVPPKENLAAIEKALKKGGNKEVTTIEFPNLNHLFQEAETGNPLEYSSIEQTFSPIALESITKWIKEQVKK